MHRLRFVSQHDHAFPRGTCGVAATMMLLRYHYGRKRVPSHRDLRTALGIHLTSADKHRHYDRAPGFGVGTDQVAAYLRANHVPCRATRQKSPRQLRMLLRRLCAAPIMVIMGDDGARWGRDGHWIVLIGATADTVTYLDSSYPRHGTRPCRMRMSTFRRDWEGGSVQIADSM